MVQMDQSVRAHGIRSQPEEENHFEHCWFWAYLVGVQGSFVVVIVGRGGVWMW